MGAQNIQNQISNLIDSENSAIDISKDLIGSGQSDVPQPIAADPNAPATPEEQQAFNEKFMSDTITSNMSPQVKSGFSGDSIVSAFKGS